MAEAAFRVHGHHGRPEDVRTSDAVDARSG